MREIPSVKIDLATSIKCEDDPISATTHPTTANQKTGSSHGMHNERASEQASLRVSNGGAGLLSSAHQKGPFGQVSNRDRPAFPSRALEGWRPRVMRCMSSSCYTAISSLSLKREVRAGVT